MTICDNCGSSELIHTEKVGRGSPPKNHVRHPFGKRISWSCIWDIWECNNCGRIYKKQKI